MLNGCSEIKDTHDTYNVNHDNILNIQYDNTDNTHKWIDNVTLGDIPFEESSEFRKNTETRANSIFVTYDKVQQRFIFKNNLKEYIGSFSIQEVVKYFGSVPHNQFMKHINDISYRNSKPIIRQFIGKFSRKPIDIILHDYNSSSFMGDLEMLILLNNQLYTFKTDYLYNELSLVEDSYRHRIEITVNKLIYLLLNYTMSLIAVTSEIIKYDTDKDRLKLQLIRYSVIITNRISQFIKDQMNIIMNNNQHIYKILQNSFSMRKIVDTKITKILNECHHKDNLTDTHHIYNMDGGTISDTSCSYFTDISA